MTRGLNAFMVMKMIAMRWREAIGRQMWCGLDAWRRRGADRYGLFTCGGADR